MFKSVLFSVCFLLFQVGQSQIIDQICLGGSGLDFMNHAVTTSDGGLIIAGYTKSEDGDISFIHGNGTKDCWIVKLNADLAIEWEKTLGGSADDEAFAIREITGDGYIVCGESYSIDGDISSHHGDVSVPDMWIFKLNQSGDLLWEKSFGGDHIDSGRDIIETTDGGFTATGFAWSSNGDLNSNYGMADVWVVHLDSFGTLQWEQNFGGSLGDSGYAIISTSDDGYMIAAKEYSVDGDVSEHHGQSDQSDIWIIKLFSDGTMNWEKTFGGTDNDDPRCLTETEEGDVICASYSQSDDGDVSIQYGNGDIWTFSITHSGILNWEKSYGGSESDAPHDLKQIGNQFMISGFSESNDGGVVGHYGDQFTSDFWVVKTDSFGEMLWNQNYGGTANDVAQFAEGVSGIVAGNTGSSDEEVEGNHGFGDIWVMKSTSVTNFSGESQMKQICLFPNPAIAILHIQLPGIQTRTTYDIYDSKGSIVSYGTIQLPKDQVQVGHLSSGIYHLTCDQYSSWFIKR